MRQDTQYLNQSSTLKLLQLFEETQIGIGHISASSHHFEGIFPVQSGNGHYISHSHCYTSGHTSKTANIKMRTYFKGDKVILTSE